MAWNFLIFEYYSAIHNTLARLVPYKGFTNRLNKERSNSSYWKPFVSHQIQNPYYLIVKEAGIEGLVVMTSEKIRVLLAEDDPLAGELIQLRLDQDGLDIIGVAYDGWEAVKMTKALMPDVLILDITMPGMDGLQVLSIVKEACPLTTVIMLTAHGSPKLMVQAIAGGASGFLTKQIVDLRRLPETIKLLVSGEEAVVGKELISAAIAQTEPDSHEGSKQMLTDTYDLTKQEKLILRLISEGYTNKEIAEKFVLSHNTIKTHVKNIFRKLGVSDRTQAAIYGVRNGFID